MNRKLSLLLVLAASLTLSACGSNKNAYGTGYSKEYLESLGIVGNPLNYKTVYFEYNSSQIDDRSRIIATAHAKNVAKKNGKTVGLEGHADERGSREYNLALGERRADAVSGLMQSVGLGGNGTNTVSYGEERPVADGSNEEAWQQNRRVEIDY